MKSFVRQGMLGVALSLAIGAVTPAMAQTAPAKPDTAAMVAELQALQAQAKDGKREFVTSQISIDDKQAAKFWRIFDDHQAALAVLNRRRMDNIVEYARIWDQATPDQDGMTAVAEEALSIEKDEADLLAGTFHRLKRVISPVQAARYVQMENKLRAIVRFELAAQIPLAH